MGIGGGWPCKGSDMQVWTRQNETHTLSRKHTFLTLSSPSWKKANDPVKTASLCSPQMPSPSVGWIPFPNHTCACAMCCLTPCGTLPSPLSLELPLILRSDQMEFAISHLWGFLLNTPYNHYKQFDFLTRSVLGFLSSFALFNTWLILWIWTGGSDL